MKKFIRCSCGSEVLCLDADTFMHSESQKELITELYISFFSVGHSGKIDSWWNRLRHIWRIIRHGTPYSDDVILNSKGMKELKRFMDMILITKENRYEEIYPIP